MPISTNPLLQFLSGSIGEITIKNYNEKIVVCKKIGPREKGKATEAQKYNEILFKAANTYAKSIYADPVKREEARLRLKAPYGNALYRAILKEYREELKQ